MGEDKKTIMVLKVDLQCSCCYKKVKKILCKFPQIKDQVYDEKAGTVTIMVMCCSPEKIRDKICCKGGKTIKCIEIKDSSPKKPKDPEKPKVPEMPKVVEKPKDPEKPKVPEMPKVVEKPKDPEKPKVPEKPNVVEKPKVPEKPKESFVEPEKPKPSNPAPQPGIIKMPDTCCGQCYNGLGGGPCYQGQGFGRPVPLPQGFPVDTCCGQCYNGLGGGPCYQGQGFGRPVPPPPGPCYDGYGYGGGSRSWYVSRCDQYFSEENPAGCSIM